MSDLWVIKRRTQLVDAVFEEKPHLTLSECVEVAMDRLIAEHEEAPVDPIEAEVAALIGASSFVGGHELRTMLFAALRRGIEIGGSK